VPTPFDVQSINNETRLTIRGSLDINSAPTLSEEIDRIIASKPAKVVVDLSFKLYKGVRSSGREVSIQGARDQPLAIFKLLRMDKVFNL
jgi:anti-sigma B factor antagonist